MDKPVIVTWRLKSNHGTKILKPHYDLLRNFILDELLMHEEITLTELMGSAEERLNLFQNKDYLHWCLLQVKLDLQARGLIRISFGPSCIQIIKIRPEAKRKIKMWSGNFATSSKDVLGE